MVIMAGPAARYAREKQEPQWDERHFPGIFKKIGHNSRLLVSCNSPFPQAVRSDNRSVSDPPPAQLLQLNALTEQPQNTPFFNFPAATARLCGWIAGTPDGAIHGREVLRTA